MGITFDVGRVTVAYMSRSCMRNIPTKFRKLHILIRFKEYFDIFSNSANGNSLPCFC